jgi:glycosyltransferase involved in cell wall biosynthesis
MILPSLRMSGGVMEALRLASDLQQRSVSVTIFVLWRSDHEVPCPNLRLTYLAPFRTTHPARLLQYLYLLSIFFFLGWKAAIRRKTRWRVVFLTHFSTFPFGWLTPWAQRYCLNQDVEWMFVPAGLRRRLLRWFILATSRRSHVVTTNTYVYGLYQVDGIHPVGQAAIWARESWLLQDSTSDRDIDVVMLVRRGHMKRADLYAAVLARLREQGFSTMTIAPDADIHQSMLPLATHARFRPSNDDLKRIYEQSKVFLLLSDTEGFALPPLEAMGAGCVPLCRDCGGPRCYMDGAFAANLIPLEADVEEIVGRVKALLDDPARLAALSSQAMQRFAEGLTASRQERDACMDILARQLSQP